jgi:hypothetical protein
MKSVTRSELIAIVLNSYQDSDVSSAEMARDYATFDNDDELLAGWLRFIGWTTLGHDTRLRIDVNKVPRHELMAVVMHCFKDMGARISNLAEMQHECVLLETDDDYLVSWLQVIQWTLLAHNDVFADDHEWSFSFLDDSTSGNQSSFGEHFDLGSDSDIPALLDESDSSDSDSDGEDAPVAEATTLATVEAAVDLQHADFACSARYYSICCDDPVLVLLCCVYVIIRLGTSATWNHAD